MVWRNRQFTSCCREHYQWRWLHGMITLSFTPLVWIIRGLLKLQGPCKTMLYDYCNLYSKYSLKNNVYLSGAAYIQLFIDSYVLSMWGLKLNTAILSSCKGILCAGNVNILKKVRCLGRHTKDTQYSMMNCKYLKTVNPTVHRVANHRCYLRVSV